MQSGGICVVCKLGFVGVRLRICWICVFGFLSGRRTVCGENDGRIGVCRSAQVDCTALISSVCPCVHEERSEYFSGEGWTLKIEHWTSKTQDDGDEDDVDNGTDEKTFYGFAVCHPCWLPFDYLIFWSKQKRGHWSKLSRNGKLYLVLSGNWTISPLYRKTCNACPIFCYCYHHYCHPHHHHHPPRICNNPH